MVFAQGEGRMAFRVCSLAFISIFSLSISTFAQSSRTYAVFDVRKSLPLKDKDTIQKDYYVNLGTEHGAKVGSILSVKRRLPVIDVYRNQAQGDLVIEIAKLKVIHTQSTMSVGRLMSVVNPKNIPVVQYESLMMGDQVELTAQADDSAAGPAQGSEPKREEASVKPKKKKPVKMVKVKVESKTLNSIPAPSMAQAPKAVVNTNPETATGTAPGAPAEDKKGP